LAKFGTKPFKALSTLWEQVSFSLSHFQGQIDKSMPVLKGCISTYNDNRWNKI